MPTNPMQRKVRNSFLFGILTMLVIVLLIGGIIFFLAIKPQMDNKKEIEYVNVYQLKNEVKSGEEITDSMLELVELPTTSVPSDYVKKIDDKATIIARIDIGKGTVLSEGMFAESEEQLEDSLRTVEYNILTLPTILDVGDYIDVRIAFANGQDLIVLSKKQVIEVYNDTITLELTEGEILIMNSAIVESFIVATSNLYVARYTQAGAQNAANVTYVPTGAVQDLIAVNGNITKEAQEKFKSRFIGNLREVYINPQVDQYDGSKQINVETGMQKQIEKARKARENYLSELNEY